MCVEWKATKIIVGYFIFEFKYTGQSISPSGTSELGCATKKTDTAVRSITIVEESLQVFLCTRRHCVLAGFTARRQS
jgi:hypothetical protein